MGIGSGELVEHLEGEERGEASSGAGADEEDRAHGSTAQDANRPDLVQIQHHLLIHLNLDRPTYALLDAAQAPCVPWMSGCLYMVVEARSWRKRQLQNSSSSDKDEELR